MGKPRRQAITGLRSTVRVLSNVTADIYDSATGALIDHRATHNLVVSAGLSLIVALLAGTATVGVTHFGYGTGTTAVTASDTALATQLARDVVTQTSQSAGTLTVKYYLSSGTANGNTLGEVGLFNAATGGTMVARALLSPTITKTLAIQVVFTWSITFSAA